MDDTEVVYEVICVALGFTAALALGNGDSVVRASQAIPHMLELLGPRRRP